MRKKPRSELPEVDCDVHGHEKEIDEIVKALSGEDGNEAKAGVFVSGIPGIGKSTVALQAGHRLDQSGHIVLFCSLRGTQGKDDDKVAELVFRQVLRVCAPDVQQIKDNSRGDLLNWCRHLDYELILILDDADDAVENLEFFKPFLKEVRTCSKRNIKFIITSRRLDITRVTTGLNIQVVKVQPLKVDESIAVLKDGANLTLDAEQCVLEKLPKIAELCQYIPHVLRLAGPLLAPESDYTLDELIQKLQGNPLETLGLDDRILSIAFQRLDEPLKHALVGLSVFPQSFERYAAEALLGEKCTERLSKLKQRCLIQQYCLPRKRPIGGSSSNYPLHKTDKNDSKRYVIHLLIRDYARQMGELELKPILRHCQQRFLEHFLSLILGYSELYWRRDSCKASLILFNEERVSLESTLADVGQEKVRYCKELKDVLEACGQVASYIGDCVPSKLYYDFLNGLLQFSESQKNVTKQVAILCLLFDESRRHGGLLEKSKRLMIIDQAIKLHKDNRSSFQQDSVSEIFYLSHYGRYLSQDLRKRDDAQPLLRKAVSMFEEENQRNCASTFDMGRVLSQMGHNERMDKEKDEIRHKEALTCYKDALSFRQTHYGEHIVTALAHKDLADYYLYINDFGKAEQNYEAAERIFEDLEMMKQKEAVPTYKNLGRCYERNDKIKKARKKFEMGCDIANTTIEGNHKWKVEINTYLALLLYKLDEFTKANELSESVFPMAEKLEMEMWHDKEELETFYKRHRHQVTTV